jgi:hypothetical protein
MSRESPDSGVCPAKQKQKNHGAFLSLQRTEVNEAKQADPLEMSLSACRDNKRIAGSGLQS